MLMAQAACRRFQGGRIPLLAADRCLSGSKRGADGAQHVVERERARRVHAQEALDCFLRTSMDLLVLGDTMVSRQDGAAK